MSLSDGEVAVLCDQAAELAGTWLPGARLTTRVAPAAVDDPYRWPSGGSWQVRFDLGGGDVVSLGLAPDDEPAAALARLLDGLGEVGETAQYWGRALPPCEPGHPHQSRVEVDGASVVLRCPATARIVDRVTPEGPRPL